MFQTILLLAACGGAGAFTYSFPAYLKALSRKPPTPFAHATLGFSMFVGSLFAMIFTNVVGHNWNWTVEPEPWPLAMVIGLGSNPLIPVIVRRLENWVETFGGK